MDARYVLSIAILLTSAATANAQPKPAPANPPVAPATDPDANAKLCATHAHDASFLRYEQATSPFSYYLLPAVGAAAGAAIGTGVSSLAPAPKSTNPEFHEFMKAFAKDVGLEHRRAIAFRIGNDAAAEVAKKGYKGMHWAEAVISGPETFEQYSNRMKNGGYQVNMSDADLRKSYELQKLSKAEVDSVRTDIKAFDESPERMKFRKRLNRLTGSNLARQRFSALLRGNMDEVGRITESMRERATMLAGSPTKPGARLVRNSAVGAAGAAIGVAAGVGANLALIQQKCGNGLSAAEATKLVNYVDVSLRTGCSVHRSGAEAIMRMPEKELMDLCKAVPQLSQIIANSYDKEMKDRMKLPKPESIEPNCANGTIKAVISNRTYEYKVSRHDKEKLDVDVKVSGKLSRPFNFSGIYDERMRKFAPHKTAALMPNSLSVANDEALTETYMGRIDQKYVDPQEESRMVAGEGFNLGRSLVPAYNAFCSGENGVPSGAPAAVEPARK
jgi:hypothetical protein